MLASVGRPCHVNVCYLKCLPWKSQNRVYFHAITSLRPKLSAGGLSTRFPRNRCARMHAMSWLARLDAYGACEFLPSKLLSSCVVKRLHAAAIKAASLLVDIHAPEAHLFCAAQGLHSTFNLFAQYQVVALHIFSSTTALYFRKPGAYKTFFLRPSYLWMCRRLMMVP